MKRRLLAANTAISSDSHRELNHSLQCSGIWHTGMYLKATSGQFPSWVFSQLWHTISIRPKTWMMAAWCKTGNTPTPPPKKKSTKKLQALTLFWKEMQMVKGNISAEITPLWTTSSLEQQILKALPSRTHKTKVSFTKCLMLWVSNSWRTSNN